MCRPELSNDGVPNVDAVLTTRELGDLIKTMGINFHNLPEEEFDAPWASPPARRTSSVSPAA